MVSDARMSIHCRLFCSSKADATNYVMKNGSTGDLLERMGVSFNWPRTCIGSSPIDSISKTFNTTSAFTILENNPHTLEL